MDHKEKPEQPKQPEQSEQLDERLQKAVDIITGAPAEKRDTIIANMLAILLTSATDYRPCVGIEEAQKNIDVLKKYLGEQNANVLMESIGFIQHKDKIFLDTPHVGIASRLTYLREHFKEDLITFDMEKARAELDASLKVNNIIRTSHTLPEYTNMPDELWEKFARLRDGELLAEGTVLFSDGRKVFRLAGEGEIIEWQNDLLFDKFQHGTYVKIYRRGLSLEVR